MEPEKITITINGNFLQEALEIYGKTVTKEFDNLTSLEFISMEVDENFPQLLNVTFTVNRTRYN